MTLIVRVLRKHKPPRGKQSVVYGMWDTDSSTGKKVNIFIPHGANPQTAGTNNAQELWDHADATDATEELREWHQLTQLNSTLPQFIDPDAIDNVTTLLLLKPLLKEWAGHILREQLYRSRQARE